MVSAFHKAGNVKIYGLQEDLLGSGMHRVVFPLTALNQAGHFCQWSHHVPDRPHEFDILLTQRFVMPQLMPMWRALRKQSSPKLVMDLDDDYFNVPEYNNAYPFWHDETILKNFRETLSTAHLLTVATPYLAEVYSRYNDNVVVLPNYIPDFVVRPLALNQKFQLGWSGGNSHSRDLDSIADAVNGFLVVEPTEHINIVGQDYAHKFSNARWYRWENDYAQYIQRLRMRVSAGIAVTNRDEFSRGKSDIKLLEYAIAGALPIYSGLPPYDVEHRVPGLVVDPNAPVTTAWVNAFLWLYDNPSELNRLIGYAYEEAKRLVHSKNIHEREQAYERILSS